MSKLKPSGALFSCEPGECQDLYPPSPSSSPRQCRCLANPGDSPQKSPPSPNKATRRVFACVQPAGRWGQAACSVSPCPQPRPRGHIDPPSSAVPGCIAAAQILDSFLGPVVSNGILILFFPPFSHRRKALFLGATEPCQTRTPTAYFWSPLPASS